MEGEREEKEKGTVCLSKTGGSPLGVLVCCYLPNCTDFTHVFFPEKSYHNLKILDFLTAAEVGIRFHLLCVPHAPPQATVLVWIDRNVTQI